MSVGRVVGVAIVAATLAFDAQQRGGTAATDTVPAVNAGVVRDSAQLSRDPRPWGGSNGVAIGRDGRVRSELVAYCSGTNRSRHSYLCTVFSGFHTKYRFSSKALVKFTGSVVVSV